jgi:hypothetical protein
MKNPTTPRRSNRKKPLKSENPKSICIPVPSKTLVKPSHTQEEKTRVMTSNFNIYKEQSSHFQLTQSQSLFILRLSTSKSIPLQFFSVPVFKLLHQTTCEMMLNEIELVLWGIYLDRFVWREVVNHLKLMLYMTAFAVKSYMGSAIEPFSAYLSFKFHNFSACFNKWLVNAKPRLAVSPKELNKKFSLLSKRIGLNEQSLLNVNFLVDEILDKAPPYSQDKNLKVDSASSSLQGSYFDPNLPCASVSVADIEGKEVLSEDETQPPALMVRMDSVFAYPCKSEMNDAGNMKMSFDVANSWMLENLEHGKETIEEENLPQLTGEVSFFTLYMSQS